MSDIEFDILDELYFLISYDELKERLDIEENTLKEQLRNLYGKGWIRCFEPNSENDITNLDYFDNKYKFYYYLASKAGLLAHNSK